MKTSEIKCHYCQTAFEKSSAEIKRQRKKDVNKRFYCSRACQAKYHSSLTHHNIYKTCPSCKKEFTSTTYADSRKCCSLECARKYSSSFQTELSQLKKSIKLKKPKTCLACSSTYYGKNKKYCSRKCSNVKRNNSTLTLCEYRRLCQFRFSLNDFPNEFDFNLINMHGWYSPTNKKNNPNGVSRDHIISVHYGFHNSIDPSIISHPANCQLILQKENVKKYTKSHLTIEELKIKINLWNLKYPQKD